MRWMNDYDIESARRRFGRGNTPNRTTYVVTQLDADDDSTRTEVCLSCHDELKFQDVTGKLFLFIMARSDHATYTAADRYERRASRRRVTVLRRQRTRSAIVLAALREV